MGSSSKFVFAFVALLTSAIPAMVRAQATTDNLDCPTRERIFNSKTPFDTRWMTGMVGILPCWDADEGNDSYRYLADRYAHWSLREITPQHPPIRDYDNEKQPALLRLFVGQNVSMVSSIRIDLRDPDMTFVIPLASFAYQGRVGQGEAWSTDLTGDDQTSPFFRIGPTTSARIKVSAKSTTELEVKATAKVLEALRNLTTVVSPGAALITTLNRESLQQTSSALDNALSSIWSEAKDESQTSGRQLSEWYEPAGYIVQVTIPKRFRAQVKKGEARTQTSRWYSLSLSCPRYSIFDPQQACDDPSSTKNSAYVGLSSPHMLAISTALKGRLSTQRVNNFKLASGKTLQQFLAGQDWYTRFLRLGDAAPGNDTQKAATDASAPAIATTNAAKPPVARPRAENDFAAVCNSIVDSLYSVGLSTLDARIGLWATVGGSADFVGIKQNAAGNAACIALIPPGFVNFDEDPAPPINRTPRSPLSR